jgi:2-polyprenyl-6-methoxyphenol hydroxylase-like FAD-dependent oxidoreductase
MTSAAGQLLLLSFLTIAWTTTVTSLCTFHHPTTHHLDHDVIIVGGSITGIATAVALKTQLNSPINTQIYERATSLEPTGALLSLFPNGMTALQYILGDLQTTRDPKATLCDKLNEQSVPLQRTIIKQVQGGRVTDERVVKSVDKSNEGKSPGRYILWYQLQNILLEALEASSSADENCLSLGCEFQSYSFDKSTGLIHATFKSRNDTGEITFTKTCRLLIGADGIRSTLRPLISRSGSGYLPPPQIRSYKRIIFRAQIDATGVASDLMPTIGVAVVYKSATNVGQIFKLQPCSEAKIVALTATASTEEDTEETVRQWNSNEAISNWRKAFSDFTTDVLDLIDQVPTSSVYANCVSDLQLDDKDQSPTLCWSNGDEPVVLVGDAVHGMTPSLGQGANVCLEDAVELAMILRHMTETADSSIRDMTYEQVMETARRLQSVRNDRVVEIHRSSRNQASLKLSAESSLKNYQEKNEDFFRRLYEWKPTSF